MAADRSLRLTPEELDDAQRSLYERIAGGDRAKGAQHFPLTDGDGALTGPFGVMLHAPGVGMALQELGAAIRFRSDLTARIREIAILQVAQATGSRFEWWAHERVGRAVGLREDEISQLALGCFTSVDAVESAAATLCGTLLHSSAVSDEEFTAAKAQLSTRQITELAVLVGYYVTLAKMMAVFDVSVPEDDVTAVAPTGHGHHCAH